MNKQVRSDSITDAQIAHWKNQHPNREIIRVWSPVTSDTIEVDDKEVAAEVAAGYFLKPNLETLGMVSKIGEKDQLRAVRVFFDNLWLGGDERITKRDESVVSAIKQLRKQFRVLESEVEKL